MTSDYLRAIWRLLRARYRHWLVEDNIADNEHQVRVHSAFLDYWMSQRSAASVELTVAENELDRLTKQALKGFTGA